MGEGFWEEGGEEERRNKSHGKGGEAGRGWEERRNNEGRGREERTEEEAGGQSPAEPSLPRGSSAGRCCAGTQPRTPRVPQGLTGPRRGDGVAGTSWRLREYLNPLLNARCGFRHCCRCVGTFGIPATAKRPGPALLDCPSLSTVAKSSAVKNTPTRSKQHAGNNLLTLDLFFHHLVV